MATTNNKFLVKNGLAVGSSIDVINSDGQWIGATGTLSGATGPQGASGAQGIDGASGYVGQDGATGQTGATGPGGVWSYINSNTNAQTGGQYVADTSSGAFTLTLPASPSTGYNVTVADGGNWSTNNLIIGRNGSIIEGDAEDLTVDIGEIELKLIYDGSEWQLFSSIGAGGATGVQGASGAQGNEGASGATGTQGASGISGASGYVGSDGATGPQGASGIAGASGAAASSETLYRDTDLGTIYFPNPVDLDFGGF